jgi:predicted DNA-binding transcriptional regulator YafY
MGKVTNFPLDRIRRLREERTPYRKNHSIDFNEYFEDIIGVTHDERAEPVRILMKIDPVRAPYVLTKPLHGSQKNGKLEATGLEISLELIPNNEFYQQILSFGDQLVILEPEDIRLKVREILQRALDKYGEDLA